MKKLAFLFAGASALALAACGGADEAAEDDTDLTVIEEEPAPVATETTVVEDGDDADSSLTVDGDDVDVRVDEDGASVDAEVDTNN